MRELTAPRAGGITAALFGAWADADAHRPRLVWHGVGRTELSTASLMNWSAKTAGYLVDELGAEPGDPVLWRVRRSWQGLPLLLGCWWAGLTVVDDEALAGGDVVAAFVDVDDDTIDDLAADEIVVASAHPFGLAVPDLPPHQRNVADAILPQADRFSPRAPGPGADATALVTGTGTVTVGAVLAGASRAAAAVGAGGVLLSAQVPSLPDGVVAGPIAAWAAGGTYVFAAPPTDRIAADERATVILGAEVAGLPRISGS